MKRLYILILLILLDSNFTQAQPLNGSYTVGSGGNFPTINSAVNAAFTRGVSGPVVFNIKPGTYNEETAIPNVSGNDSARTITFQSETGDASDVQINGNSFVFRILNNFVVIRNLTIGSCSNTSIEIFYDWAKILDNIFTASSKRIRTPSQFPPSNIEIRGNTNIPEIDINPFGDNYAVYLDVANNSISGEIKITYYGGINMEKNIMRGLNMNRVGSCQVNKNKIHGNFGYTGTDALISNNFVAGNTDVWNTFNFNISLIYNTLVGGTLNRATLLIPPTDHIVMLNNIIINPSGGLALRSYTDSAFESSDYNNFYNGGISPLINSDDTLYNSVTEYYNATGFDEHSNSFAVNFVSHVDFHLAGNSIGDQRLIGIPTNLVTDDIDGHMRNPLYPYKGADEADVPLPVEFSSFTSTSAANSVDLIWTTNSEINNGGFDIERKWAQNKEWEKVGFVNGNGTTNSPNSYEFKDRNLLPGNYNYRLKQIDLNGNFEYHNLSDEVIIGTPKNFQLDQNYPNPFNPTTRISFELPEEGRTSLVIYDMLGKEVIKLVNNENKSAGRYTVEFNGSNLSSGVYFYRLESNKFEQTMRMVLIK